jgi:hypothetical protein
MIVHCEVAITEEDRSGIPQVEPGEAFDKYLKNIINYYNMTMLGTTTESQQEFVGEEKFGFDKLFGRVGEVAFAFSSASFFAFSFASFFAFSSAYFASFFAARSPSFLVAIGVTS